MDCTTCRYTPQRKLPDAFVSCEDEQGTLIRTWNPEMGMIYTLDCHLWTPIGAEAIDPKSRYYDKGGLEVMEIIKAKLTPDQFIGFLLGNILKYGCRLNWKGVPDRDAEKIGMYQKRLHEALKAKEHHGG